MLDLLSGVPRDVAFGDRRFKIGALKLREFAILAGFIREHAVRPTEAVKEALEFYPEEEHRQLKKEAFLEERDNWPPSVGTEAGHRILFGCEDGQKLFLQVMLGKYRKDPLSDAEVDEIMGGLSPTDFGVLVAIAFGEDLLDPEALRATVLETMNGTPQDVARETDPSTSGESTTTTSQNIPPTSDPGKSTN